MELSRLSDVREGSKGAGVPGLGFLCLSSPGFFWWMRVAEGSGWQTCSAARAEVEGMPKDLMWSFP